MSLGQKVAPVSCGWHFQTFNQKPFQLRNAGSICELLIENVGFWTSAPFNGSKLGHNLQTSFNNNANSLVQDPKKLFHQLNRRMPLGLKTGS